MDNQVRELLGDFAGPIGKTFGMMEVAEEEIEGAMLTWPEHREAIWNSFMLLCPGGMFNEVADKIYRKHCRELLARVVDGKDTRFGTKAEIMCGMVETSLRCPMNDTGQYLYERLFLDLFGNESEIEDVIGPIRKAVAHHEGLGHDWQYKETLAKMRKLFFVKDRVPKKEEEWKSVPTWIDTE